MIAGQTFSHYRIIALLGAGGMGEVYKAEDTRLQRLVALKFLPLASTEDPEAKERLVHEARAASALDHPNICTIHEIDETPDGRIFLAMAYYEGETLRQRIARGRLGFDEVITVMTQVARGASAAHDAGIIHRDIKPANIVLTRRGEVKLLDFGLAKLSSQTVITRTGTTVGTVAYMAPEQIEGQGANERSDVWALGVVLYEMLAGRLPFTGAHDAAVLRAITDHAPPALRSLRPDVPPALESIVEKALQKKPQGRYASALEFLQDIERLHTPSLAAPGSSTAVVPAERARSRQRLMIGAALVLVGVIAASGWFLYQQARARAARQSLQQVSELVRTEDFSRAFFVLWQLEPSLAGDAEFVKVRDSFLWTISIDTDPPGADIYVKRYADAEGDWQHLGRSPLATYGCFCNFRWRVTKPGFSPFEGTRGASARSLFTLAPEADTPAGMVRVAGGSVMAPTGVSIPLGDFFIDRFEVTNRDFKRFMEAGGYKKQEYWTDSFVKGTRTLAWGEAMAEFQDATGRPGPSTWELGTYPEGQDDHPVSGVSWYEAAAFARFAGKTLPTVHHWRVAAGISNVYSDILELSNFAGKGPSPVGAFKGIAPYGAYDMAGNIKEWCSNEVSGRRYILGGGWNEPNYQFRGADARFPFDRSAQNGFRTIKRAGADAIAAVALEPVERLQRDYTQEKPVNDEVFRAYASLYSYDKGDLKASVDSVDDSSPIWRVERITYATAYGDERMPAYLYLPKHATPPYQTVVYYPHGSSRLLRSFEQAEMSYLGFIVKAGRALLLPMYKGTYERRLATPASGLSAVRDLTVQEMKDLSQSVDYLRTRPDIDHDRLAYFGVSFGAWLGPISLAVEPRFKTAVLWSGGLPLDPRLPDADPMNFAPRVSIPVLMLNGREDFTFPVETSQIPLFRLLGTREEDKRRVLYDGGHVFPFARVQKDTLDWLDRYLGASQ